MARWKAYDYTSQWVEDGVIARPLIRVELSNDEYSFPALALLDSGTDATILDYEVANALGINLKLCKEVKVGGIGEKKGYRCDINFAFPDLGISTEMPVVFVEKLPFNMLLGQRYFFGLVDVRFEKANNKFFLKKR